MLAPVVIALAVVVEDVLRELALKVRLAEQNQTCSVPSLHRAADVMRTSHHAAQL